MARRASASCSGVLRTPRFDQRKSKGPCLRGDSNLVMTAVAPLGIEARKPERALSALRPGVAVGEELLSLGGFRARSTRCS